MIHDVLAHIELLATNHHCFVKIYADRGKVRVNIEPSSPFLEIARGEGDDIKSAFEMAFAKWKVLTKV